MLAAAAAAAGLPAVTHVASPTFLLLPRLRPLQIDLTHINILAELYCDAGDWREALGIVQRAERELLGEDEELPIDLRVRG